MGSSCTLMKIYFICWAWFPGIFGSGVYMNIQQLNIFLDKLFKNKQKKIISPY